MLAGTSSGCEPVFSLYYQRNKKCNPGETPDFIDQNGIGFTTHNVIHGSFKDWFKTQNVTYNLEDLSIDELNGLYNVSPWFNNTANDIVPEARITAQSILQKYTTHSISSTINLPAETTKETIDLLYKLASKSNLKGVTVYRDGCRTGILNRVSDKKEEMKLTERPVELECKVVHFKNEKKDWVAFVGIMNSLPYEIFTGPKDMEVFPIPCTVEKGQIIKVKQDDGVSRYDFRYIDNYGYTNTLGGLSRIFDKEYWNYARYTSALLRHETPVDQVVKVIEGLSFTNKGMNSWKSGIIRSLKTFIKDGTASYGEKCTDCGQETIIYEGGCKICKSCGNSKCS